MPKKPGKPKPRQPRNVDDDDGTNNAYSPRRRTPEANGRSAVLNEQLRRARDGIFVSNVLIFFNRRLL